MTKTGLIGARDESHVVKQGDIYPQLELGELAARIGGVHSFKRSGDVYFCYDFSMGLQGLVLTPCGGSSHCYLSNFGPGLGGVCVYLYHYFDMTNYSHLDEFFALPSGKSLGLEVWFGQSWDDNDFVIGLTVYKNNKKYTFKIRVMVKTLCVYMRTADGWTELLNDFEIRHQRTDYNFLKLVIDLDNLVLQRVYFNEETIDTSGYTPEQSTELHVAGFALYYGIRELNGGVTTHYIYNILLTHNEPLPIC
jgi:hypothetical protein